MPDAIYMINPEVMASDRSDGFYEYNGELGGRTNRGGRHQPPKQQQPPQANPNSTRKPKKQPQQMPTNRQYQSDDEGDQFYISEDGRLTKSRMVAPLKNPNSIHDYLYLLAKKNDSGTHYFLCYFLFIKCSFFYN
jgi:hypothetical protein